MWVHILVLLLFFFFNNKFVDLLETKQTNFYLEINGKEDECEYIYIYIRIEYSEEEKIDVAGLRREEGGSFFCRQCLQHGGWDPKAQAEGCELPCFSKFLYLSFYAPIRGVMDAKAAEWA